MERIARPARRWMARNLLLAGSFTVGLTFGGVAAAGVATPTGTGSFGAVPFTSGGVGETERAQMDEASRAYNLRVVMARPTGEYLSGVRVNIHNAQGAAILSTVTEGPWLLVRLPPGTYTVQAATGDQTRQAAVRVDRDHQAKVVMHLRDAGSPGPMATLIR